MIKGEVKKNVKNIKTRNEVINGSFFRLVIAEKIKMAGNKRISVRKITLTRNKKIKGNSTLPLLMVARVMLRESLLKSNDITKIGKEITKNNFKPLRLLSQFIGDTLSSDFGGSVDTPGTGCTTGLGASGF